MTSKLQLPRFSNILVAIIATLVVSACTSGPKIFVNEDPNTDFSPFTTYNYENVLGTDGNKGYRSVISNYLIAAMDNELQARGYQKAENPDLTVNFYVNSEEKIRTTSQPTSSMGGYYGYRGGYYGAYGGYETTVTQWTEGTVNIDLINKKTATLVWEGVAVGKVTDEVRANLEEVAKAVVAEVMSKYPHYAAGFVPPAPTKNK